MSKKNFINKSTLVFISSVLLLTLFCTMGMSFAPAEESDNMDNPNNSTNVTGPRRSHWKETGECGTDHKNQPDYGTVYAVASTGGTVTLSGKSGSTYTGNGTANASVTWNCGYNSDGEHTTEDLHNKHTNTITFTATPATTNYEFDGWYSDETYSTFVSPNASFSEPFTIGYDSEGQNRSTDYESAPGQTWTRYAKFVKNEPVDITFIAPGDAGEYTVTINGSSSTVKASDVVKTGVTKEVTLTATAAAGYVFIGWYQINNEGVLSDLGTSASLEKKFTGNVNVGARFVSTSLPKFVVKETGVEYYGLKAALAAAEVGQTVVPTGNHTVDGADLMPAENGVYTIPGGVTLLIPYDAEYTVVTNTPSSSNVNKGTASVFRKLTLTNNVTLNVTGSISVAAEQIFCAGGGQMSGYTNGKFGQLVVSEGCTINLNGGNLYAWGFVTGDGHINAYSGSNVYEPLQLDWRGGSYGNSYYNTVLIINQFYVQNIECYLTLFAGSREEVCTSIYVNTVSTEVKKSVPFVASDGLFYVKNGSLTKHYDVARDRQVYDMDGDAQVQGIEMNIVDLLIFKIDLNSKNLILPITNNMTVNVHSGTTSILYATSLLADAEVTIDEGATIKARSNLFIYDKDDYVGKKIGLTGDINSVPYSPTKTKTRSSSEIKDAKVLVNGTLELYSESSYKGYLYTTPAGADICSTGNGVIKLSKGVGSTTSFKENKGTDSPQNITVTAAQLHNGNGSYTKTTGAPANTTVYYKNGHWGWKVTWKDDNDDVIKTEYCYTTPSDSWINSNKPADPEQSCKTFYSWSQTSNDETNQERVYTATYTTHTYAITYSAGTNGSGTVTGGTKTCGVSFTLSTDKFTRTGYEQTGWSIEDGGAKVYEMGGTYSTDEAKTFYPFWTANEYTITYNDKDDAAFSGVHGSSYPTKHTYGAATTLVDPTKEGYTFEGWFANSACTGSAITSLDATAYTADITLYAKWIPVHTLTITATPAGYGTVSPESVANVPEGSTVTDNGDNTFTVNGTTVEATPKAADEQYTYTFKQWNNMPDAVTGDVTIEAEFARTTNKYTITWIDGNGETLLSEQLAYGQMPNYTGETPGKDMTTGVVYTFKGWDSEPTTVTGNATYTATFHEDPRPYPVLWVDWDGHTLAWRQRSYGDPAPPASQNTSIPTRASENGKVYTFSGWSDPVSVVEGGDVTYTALYRVDLLANEPSHPVEINENTEVVTTTVRVSGALHIANNAKLTTTDLILEAGESQSGEITGNVVANNVYFDLAIEADKRHWNVFGVPFEIGDLDNTKLQYKNSGETTWHNMILGTHYDITYHDEATRASRGPVYDCWKYIEDLPAGNRTLQPGVAYSISLLFHVDTLRFTKASNSPIHYSENVDLVNTNTGDATNGGWNGIANPTTYHTLLATGVDMIQIHDGGEIGHDTYDAYRIEDYKFVVGKAGYVQVTAAHSILDVDEAGGQAPIPSPVHAAPRRSNGITASELYTVELSAENMRTDRVYVKADEDKADEYTIGSDVMKLSTSQARPQIWVEQYNVKLCKSTMAPVNGQTVYPLGLYAPVAGEYTITNNQSAEVEEENTLYLTYDGLPIWNLTDAPYSIQLEKGTNMHYGLLLVRNYAPSVTTGNEEIQTGLQAAQKVLWNNQVYILRGGEVYTATGKKVQ